MVFEKNQERGAHLPSLGLRLGGPAVNERPHSSATSRLGLAAVANARMEIVVRQHVAKEKVKGSGVTRSNSAQQIQQKVGAVDLKSIVPLGKHDSQDDNASSPPLIHKVSIAVEAFRQAAEAHAHVDADRKPYEPQLVNFNTSLHTHSI